MGILNFTARTWGASELVTAALLNQEVRDPLNNLQSAWTSYTPTWRGAVTNPTIGNGSLSGSYHRFGKTVIFRINLDVGSTTTIGSGKYEFDLPVTANVVGASTGSAFLNDASTNFWVANAVISTTNRIHILNNGSTQAWSNGGFPMIPASGDQFRLFGIYEAA